MWSSSPIYFTAGMPGAPTFLNPVYMTISLPSQTFQWTSVPGARYYPLTLGRQQGGYEVLFSGALGPNQTAYFAGAVSNRPLWARVYSYVDGSWNHYTDVPYSGMY